MKNEEKKTRRGFLKWGIFVLILLVLFIPKTKKHTTATVETEPAPSETSETISMDDMTKYTDYLDDMGIVYGDRTEKEIKMCYESTKEFVDSFGDIDYEDIVSILQEMGMYQDSMTKYEVYTVYEEYLDSLN